MEPNSGRSSLHYKIRTIFAVGNPFGRTAISFRLRIGLRTVSQLFRRVCVRKCQFSSIRSNVPYLLISVHRSCMLEGYDLQFLFGLKLQECNFHHHKGSQSQRQWVFPWCRNCFSWFFYPPSRRLCLP